MDYKAKITVATGKLTDKVYRCFVPETDVKTERSSFTLKKQKECIVFDVSAKDAVALKATLNSISKLLTVFEKMKDDD